jgi:hypothetical protein
MSSLTRAPAIVLLALAVASVLLLGCQAGAGTSTATRTPSATPAPATVTVPALDATYQSAVYGYSIDYPEYFSVRPATRRLDGAETPWVDSAGVDQLSAAATIVIGSGDLAAGMDMEGWIGNAITPVCGQPASADPVAIGGEPGRLLMFTSCNGYFHLWATTVHGPAGYHIVWVSDPGSEAESRAIFSAILASFKFGQMPLPAPS